MSAEYRKIVEFLKSGEKYTIVKYGEFGFLSAIQLKLETAKVEPYAQHDETLVIIGTPKRKRSIRGFRIYNGSPRFIIWAGWVEPNTEMYVESENNNETGVTVRTSERSFSNGYIERALKSVDQAPLFKQTERN